MTTACAILALIALVWPPGEAFAQSGIQVSPDGKRVLVSKDLAGQRWAITRNPDGTVTGNVFSPSGGPPQFVWCEQTSSSGGELGFACSGAEACPLAPCEADEWVFIAEVTLPESFFANEATTSSAAWSAVVSVLPSPMTSFAHARVAGTDGGVGAASGLQVTPDGLRNLISKDVGDQRWAISRNEDGTATGNVFFPGGGDPQFVWCEQTGESGDDVLLRCLGADACPRDGTACTGGGWTLIADDVPLPASFFLPRTEVTIEAVEAMLVASLGEDGAASAFTLAVDRGYSLRQILRAALAGRLRASGEVEDRSGVIEPPAGPPFGLFTGTTEAARVLANPGNVSLAELLARLKDEGRDAGLLGLKIIVLLAHVGYALDQIVEELYFGARFVIVPELGPLLADQNGEIIIPRRLESDVIAPPPSVPKCGNGTVEGVEECDGTDFGGKTCESSGASGPGQLRCVACRIFTWDCKCGNGNRDGSEECDGSDLRGRTCASYGLGAGSLSCKAACTIDTSSCGSACASGGAGCCEPGDKRCNGQCIPQSASCCGDGIRQGSEQCDGADLGPGTCSSQGQGSGTLGCTGSCDYDTSGCTGGGSCSGNTFPCENGCAPNGADCCEGENGYCAPGTVCVGNDSCCPSATPKRCGTTCVAENASCCGNGNVDEGEVCDGADLAGETCTSQGRPPGALRCASSCTAFDYADCGCESGFKLCEGSCVPESAVCCGSGGGRYCPAGSVCTVEGCCGDGVLQGGEDCDPPGTGGGCGAGATCSNDCSACVSTTSCADRCCPGRNDSCTAPGVSCYCDQYCLEAGDCCADYGPSCGG